MSKYDKAIVASGHPQVCDAAAQVLEQGGNAFDAVVAAGFASSVVESSLSSLGGGGLLVGHSAASGQNLFFDFFVDSPGRGLKGPVLDPHFFPVTVQFSGSDQEFKVGLASVAVPGTLKGLLHIHRRLGFMDLAEVVSPAVELAKGHKLNGPQAHILHLLAPIMCLCPEGAAIYAPQERYLQEGDWLVNNDLAAFIGDVVRDGGNDFYCGEIAAAIAGEMEEGEGMLTLEDLVSYEVKERSPLEVPYGRYQFLTAAEPSFGGALIGLSLLLGGSPTLEYGFGSGEHLLKSTRLMQEVEAIRKKGFRGEEGLWAYEKGAGNPLTKRSPKGRLFSRGTTHVSIADKDGNCAAMTCSNGEGSGYFAPGTGVMLNNMMGEDDLHPDGFHSGPPGLRVGSMMAPSLVLQGEEIKLVIGSGGSKRIRTAVSQVLEQVFEWGRPLQEAVDAPRLHWDGEVLQIEPGYGASALARLATEVMVNEWQGQGVYFGGVHAVIPGREGAADGRRGGQVREIF